MITVQGAFTISPIHVRPLQIGEWSNNEEEMVMKSRAE